LPTGAALVDSSNVEAMEPEGGATESRGRTGLLDEDQRVAAWIRTYRQRRNLTLAQLSELSGISAGHLSRLENGTRTPTVRLLLQLARALGVSVGTLVGEPQDQNTAYVSRRTDRKTITTGDTVLQSLADPALRALQAVELDLQAGRVGEPAAHAGEEWLYVVSGTVDVDVNGSTFTLAPGDAIHFHSDLPHALHNPYDEPTTVLVINALGATAPHVSY
jgi:transcriptional regulator with XRE-family HTH domain